MAELKNTIVNGVLNVNGDLIASKITLRGDPGSLLRGNGSVITTGSNGQFLSISNGVPTWITPTKLSVGLGNVDNTADANKTVDKANLLNPHQNVSSTIKSSWDPTNSGKIIWGQGFKDNSISSDSGDLTLFLRRGQYSPDGTELCMNIDGDYYSFGKKVIHSGGGTLTGNLNPATTKGASLGTSSLYWNNIYGTTIYENGTALSSKYLGINDTAKTATNLVSFVHTYHRPTASGGDGKQWMRILNFVDNDIANGSRWYGKAVDIEFYNNGYGNNGNFVYMGHVSICVAVHNKGTFEQEDVTIKWRDCKPDIWAPDHIKAVKNANSVEIFMLNDIWDTAITGVIVRNQGLDVAASSTCYTQEEFTTYINGKSVVTGIIDTNLAIGRLDNYTKKSIKLWDNVDLNTITSSGFYRLMNHTQANFPHSQMIVCRGEDTIAQIIFPWSATKMYVRTGNNITSGSSGSWRDWKEVAFTDNINNGTLDLATSGTGISGSATFTANQSSGSKFTVALDSSAAGNRGANKVVLAKADGQIDSDKFTVTSAGTTKASFSYNSSTDCVELTWM